MKNRLEKTIMSQFSRSSRVKNIFSLREMMLRPIFQPIALEAHRDFEIDDKGPASLLATVARTYAFSHFHSSSTQRRGKSMGQKSSFSLSFVSVSFLSLILARSLFFSAFATLDCRRQKQEQPPGRTLETLKEERA